jgi:aryl-alcohol dehydrogenase-like predicted oxidoreductase
MRMKLLGERTGVQVSPLALGTGRLGLGPGGDVNLGQARDAIAAYLDAGGNLVDTSTRYLGGRAEELLGELMRGSRGQPQLRRDSTARR